MHHGIYEIPAFGSGYASSLSFSSRAAALVSRVSRLSRSTLARACTPLTTSEEKERLLAVYKGANSAAASFNMYQGITSGPLAFLQSTF